MQDFTPTEAKVSSASSTPLVLINGDNKLAHIKLPAMSAGGAGGNSGKIYSFKVVLLGEGCVGKTSLVLRYCEYKFNEKHITTLQVRPVEPLAPRLNKNRFSIPIPTHTYISVYVCVFSNGSVWIKSYNKCFMYLEEMKGYQ